jgi:hypothetical protein
MQHVLEILQNLGPILAAINGLCLALIAICAAIPGAPHIAVLQKIVDFIASISKK